MYVETDNSDANDILDNYYKGILGEAYTKSCKSGGSGTLSADCGDSSCLYTGFTAELELGSE